MKKDTVEFKRRLTPNGNSYSITVPKELMEFLGAESGTILALSGFSGKHGKYVAFWIDTNEINNEDIKQIVEKEAEK